MKMGQSGEEEHTVYLLERMYILYIYVFFACDELNSRNIGWRRRGGSWSSDCCSYCNVRGKRVEGQMVGDRGIVTEEGGKLFVRSLGGGKK